MHKITQITQVAISAAQGGDQDAMMAVLDHCESTIRSIVYDVTRVASRGPAAEDLIQDARIAVMELLRGYDADAGTSLITFIYRAVRRVVAEGWATEQSSFTIPPGMVIEVRRALATWDGDVESAREDLETNSSRTHRVSRESFTAALDAMTSAVSLQATAGESLTVEETIADPEHAYTQRADRKALARRLLSEIPARQAYALRAFYGIGMMQTPDHQTATEMGISLASLRQLRHRGVQNCRAAASTLGLAA
ncbi:sigma-70 family RNA polymerase sigma factor [Streptomyces sp. CAU 1734]|uniref:sigma-70 family RNA polymerase sigma factor n=1 Tax=Streptomyces sp. CAU 1734 TaxID=3140360 RepID=UPI00326118DA